MKPRLNLKVGEKFIAIVKKGEHSKNLMGEEGAGRELGPFRAIKITLSAVETECSVFSLRDFDFRKVEAKNEQGQCGAKISRSVSPSA